MKILTAAIELVTHILQSKSAFVVFAFLLASGEAMAIWALWASGANKSILLRRKELGMNEVDQAIEAIFRIMTSHYLTLAKQEFGDDYFNRKETALYRYLLRFALDDLVPSYRIRIRRNHFNEKSSAEWAKYVKDCIDDDMRKISRYLDEHYHPQAKISRPDLYDWNTKKFEEMRRVFNNLFTELLHIAETNKLKKFMNIEVEFWGKD